MPKLRSFKVRFENINVGGEIWCLLSQSAGPQALSAGLKSTA